MQQCLNDAPRATALEACKGRWSNLCQAQPQGGTTVGITRCIAEEISAWEHLLAEVYAKLEAAARSYDQYMPEGVSVQRSLAASKSAWLVFRDAQCDYEYSEYADGTMRGVVERHSTSRLDPGGRDGTPRHRALRWTRGQL